MTGAETQRPVVYVDATRVDAACVVVLVESLRRLVEHQPADVLADPTVKDSLRRLGETVRPFAQDGHSRSDDDARLRAFADRRAS